MLIDLETKEFETNSLFPKSNWYSDNRYVVDETTEEGKLLADKIKQHAPHYELVLDENNNLIDITPTEKPFIPPSEEKINQEVRKKIADRYDYAQEIQMLNKGILNSNDVEYLEYKAYRQECIDWGIAEKQKYGYI